MSYHKQKSTCSACGYPAARLRKCNSSLIQTDGHLKLKTVKELEQEEPDISKLSQESIKIKSRDATDHHIFKHHLHINLYTHSHTQHTNTYIHLRPYLFILPLPLTKSILTTSLLIDK